MSDLDLLADQTARLLRTARGLTDVTAPSLCEGWTRGHVLTHLARNADGLARAARGALDGSGATMYDSQERRDADIEAGAPRPLAEQVADLERTAADLAPALAALTPALAGTRVPRVPDGPTFTAGRIAAMRLREVVYHHVDLDAGFGFADLDSDLLLELLGDQVRRLLHTGEGPAFRVRTDEGDTYAVGEGGPLVTGSRAGVLLWLARQRPDGVRAEGGDLPTLPTGV